MERQVKEWQTEWKDRFAGWKEEVLMVTDYQRIKNAIENAVNTLKKDFIIYPYGEYGVMTKRILNDAFGIEEKFIIDNTLSKYNCNIKDLDYCKNIDSTRYTVLFTCANPEVYKEVRNNLRNYFSESSIVDIFADLENKQAEEKEHTICGKYSYGPLCNHWLVESVGAFCSFAPGTDVVENHAVEYVSTHPFLYYGGEKDVVHNRKWKEVKGERGYFPDIQPKGNNYRLEKIHIGNDVWLGKNVIITNSANIGNGVIAGAGAVITKNIPDYAVVVGIPARIIRYRYTQEQIHALNTIAWWDWTDEKIREHYDDFYLDIEEFIHKYL